MRLLLCSSCIYSANPFDGRHVGTMIGQKAGRTVLQGHFLSIRHNPEKMKVTQSSNDEQHPSLSPSTLPTVQTIADLQDSGDSGSIRTTHPSSHPVPISATAVSIALAAPLQTPTSSMLAVSASRSDRSDPRPSSPSPSSNRPYSVSVPSAGRYILPGPVSEPSAVHVHSSPLPPP